MKPLVLKYKIKNNIRLDMSWLSNINTSNLSLIKNKNILLGNKRYKVSELFTVSGEDSNNIKLLNTNNNLDNIGSCLENKKLTIEGNIGRGLARNMVNGTIILNGNADDVACSGMKGGSVFIYGSVGNRFCSLPTGINEGFSDGFVYVQKNVGSDSIIRMRRGNIVIGGDIGVNSCRELIAGTVTVLGKIGNAFCRNPRRGTLIIKDRSICKDFIKSNSTDLTFFNFYQMKINNIIDSNVIKNKKPIRYFGTKAEKKMVELFVL